MYAISLWQPWATLLAHGKKRIETRSWPWPRSYSLPAGVAIHATKTLRDECAMLCGQEPFRAALAECGIAAPSELPLGFVVGVGRLVECVTTSLAVGTFLPDATCLASQRLREDGRERSFGDYREGRFAWTFDRLAPLTPSLAASGKQGIWQWEAPSYLDAEVDV